MLKFTRTFSPDGEKELKYFLSNSYSFNIGFYKKENTFKHEITFKDKVFYISVKEISDNGNMKVESRKITPGIILFDAEIKRGFIASTKEDYFFSGNSAISFCVELQKAKISDTDGISTYCLLRIEEWELVNEEE